MIGYLSVFRSLAGLAALLFPLLLARPAAAHPHAWIDLTSGAEFDADGRIVAVTVDWLFDEMYSDMIRADLEASGRPEAEFLADLARENVKNLADYGYFLDVRVDGMEQKVGEVESFSNAFHDTQLFLRLRIPLAVPVDPRTHAVTYAVYDPTYYIEILHLEGSMPRLSGPGADGCKAEIIAPNPSFEAVSLAASLDKTQSAGDSMGQLFAETVKIRCAP